MSKQVLAEYLYYEKGPESSTAPLAESVDPPESTEMESSARRRMNKRKLVEQLKQNNVKNIVSKPSPNVKQVKVPLTPSKLSPAV